MRKSRIPVLLLALALVFACGKGDKAEKAFVPFSEDFEAAEALENWGLSPEGDQASIQLAEENGGSYLKLESRGGDKDVFQAQLTITSDPPEERFFKLSGKVRAAGKAGLSLIADCADEDGPKSQGNSLWSAPVPEDGEWHPVDAKVYVPRGAERLRIGCLVQGAGEACFDDLAVEEIEEEYGIRRALSGPGIARAAGADDLKPARDLERLEIVFPLPMVTEYQCPLSFELDVDPPDRLISRTIVHRAGPNYVCKVEIGPFRKDELIKLRYWSDVLLTAADFSGMPETSPIPPPGSYPEDARAWLAGSLSAQTDDPRIIAAADEIRSKASENDAVSFINEMLAFIKPIEFRQPRGCDAVNMLEQGGACTSHANLGVALCRTVGIPARVIANYPTWNTALQTHYTIEAYLAGYGWVPVETSMYRFPHDPFRQINMSQVSPQDEADSFDDNRMAAGGVPKWSLNEWPVDSGVRGVNAPLNRDYCDHIASPRVEFENLRGLPDALELAKTVWNAYLAARTEGGADSDLTRAVEARLEPVPDNLKDLLKHLQRIHAII